MELFFPSKKVLETIACTPDSRPRLFEDLDGKFRWSHHVEYFTLTRSTNFDVSIESILHLIGTFYCGINGIDSIGSQSIGSVINEGLKNAKWHGSRGVEPFHLGLFLGRGGACYGFRDAGEYFKNPETKRIFESKTPITSFNKTFADLAGENNCPGGEVGVNHFLFPYSDLIEVDTDKGVLYCVQLRDRLLSKE